MLLPNKLRNGGFAIYNIKRCLHPSTNPSVSASGFFRQWSLAPYSSLLNNIPSFKRFHNSQLNHTHHLKKPIAYNSVNSLFYYPLSRPCFLSNRSYSCSRKIAERSFASNTRTFTNSSSLKEHPQTQSAKSHTQPNGEKSQKHFEQEKQDEGETEPKGKSDEKKSEDQAPPPPPPPPPPHGDKTPWQVFTETLRSEFKASKEWNESTKALASSAQDFTQNETVKRARSAYSQVSDTATSTTSAALKNTGKAIGQGAAWAWDTSVLQGVRKGANAMGSGIEKVTRPVRETEAFKNVRDVIDDGSSSRYGGWTEKEERRKKRELRELNELAKHGGKRFTAKAEEDPE